MIDEDFSSNTNVIQLGLDLLLFPLPSLSCHDLTLETYERKIRTFFNTNVQRFTLFIEIETILIFFFFLFNPRAVFPCSAAGFLLCPEVWPRCVQFYLSHLSVTLSLAWRLYLIGLPSFIRNQFLYTMKTAAHY